MVEKCIEKLLQTNPVSAIIVFILTTEKNGGKLLKKQRKAFIMRT